MDTSWRNQSCWMVRPSPSPSLEHVQDRHVQDGHVQDGLTQEDTKHVQDSVIGSPNIETYDAREILNDLGDLFKRAAANSSISECEELLSRVSIQ